MTYIPDDVTAENFLEDKDYFVKRKTIVPSEDQEKSIKAFDSWYTDGKKPLFALAGFAGCGKTTVVAMLRDLIHGPVAYMAFTGKAVSVLRSKLAAAGALSDEDYTGTIHSLIYKPQTDAYGNLVFVLRGRDEIEPFSLFVLDEGSMIGTNLLEDVLSFDVPVLLVGDNGQLDPVSDSAHKYLLHPDTQLTQIHRQAEDNPIIRLSRDIREGRQFFFGKYSDNIGIFKRKSPEAESVIADNMQRYDIANDIFLCGYNRTRVAYNTRIRMALGFNSPDPQVGDKVICLKNNQRIQVFNGNICIVHEAITDIHKSFTRYVSAPPPFKPIHLKVAFEDREFGLDCMLNQFNTEKTMMDESTQIQKSCGVGINLFDYGYCISTHKSQGSEYKHVNVIVEQNPKLWSGTKWLYTAITRASDSLNLFF